MKKVVGLNRRGFTLIEVIVVAAIIAILAGILVPMIFNQIDQSKVAKATGDAKSIQSGAMAFRKDTGKWPNYNGPNATDNAIELLRSASAGALLPTFDAAAVGWKSTGLTDVIENHLNVDDGGAYGTTWKGSYLSTAGTDPWGRPYVINADAFNGANPVWVLSAGPDGTVQTPAAATEIAAGVDDIGVRIK